MKRLMMVAGLVCAIMIPRAVEAHVGWWDVLDQFSGPGPFHNGIMVDVRPVCFVTQSDGQRSTVNGLGSLNEDDIDALKRLLACRTNRTQSERAGGGKTYSPSGFMEVRYGQIETEDDTALFQDRPGELVGQAKVKTVQAIVFKQWFDAIALGAGGGWLRFSGSNVTNNVKTGILVGAAEIYPLRWVPGLNRHSGIFSIRGDVVLPFSGMSATDFDPTSTSGFASDRFELVGSRTTLTFDFLAW
jgi:hypothetical protein